MADDTKALLLLQKIVIIKSQSLTGQQIRCSWLHWRSKGRGQSDVVGPVTRVGTERLGQGEIGVLGVPLGWLWVPPEELALVRRTGVQRGQVALSLIGLENKFVIFYYLFRLNYRGNFKLNIIVISIKK